MEGARQSHGNYSNVVYPSSICNFDGSTVESSQAISWNGEVAAAYIRNSTRVQRGNYRAKWQMDFAWLLQKSGYAVKIYDEQGVSGATLQGRAVATQMILDIRAGLVNCVAVAEVSRLTRDGRGFDPEYLADILVKYGNGKLITHEKVLIYASMRTSANTINSWPRPHMNEPN